MGRKSQGVKSFRRNSKERLAQLLTRRVVGLMDGKGSLDPAQKTEL